MTTLNDTLLTLSWALQAAVLLALFARSAARRLGFFTGLLCFYLLRSVFLLTSFHHISPASYSVLYSTFSLADLTLQVLVAWQLFSQTRAPEVGSRPSPLAFSGLALLAGALARGLSALVPANPHSPMDRGLLFTSFLMMSLAWPRTRNSPASHILLGFAALSATAIVAQVGRTLAAFHREPLAYTRWSYAEPILYLLVLFYWLVVLLLWRPRPSAIAVSRARVASL